ncbi:hypothetical protein B0T16DRAFT_58531 [Cercophora newfieldiana]|uniref:Secreted protein n=1 Tax=Cercophora newfieldiana TaxID=92897 RepID=A0AA39YRK3_9PEZI|nr:hypothetical protein B0T16DRAFT_58531 [Cercophora newfieldiana]
MVLEQKYSSKGRHLTTNAFIFLLSWMFQPQLLAAFCDGRPTSLPSFRCASTAPVRWAHLTSSATRLRVAKYYPQIDTDIDRDLAVRNAPSPEPVARCSKPQACVLPTISLHAP